MQWVDIVASKTDAKNLESFLFVLINTFGLNKSYTNVKIYDLRQSGFSSNVRTKRCVTSNSCRIEKKLTDVFMTQAFITCLIVLVLVQPVQLLVDGRWEIDFAYSMRFAQVFEINANNVGSIVGH